MNLATLVPLLLQASIALTVVNLGLNANTADLFTLPRRPSLLLRSLIALNVVMPVVALALASWFDLRPAVRIALVALALSPLPPILPRRQLKAGGSSPYVHGLLVTAALFAIIFVPLALELIERVFRVPLELAPTRVATIVLVTVLAPLATGLIFKGIMPDVAARVAKPLGLVATVLLAAGIVALLLSAGRSMVALVGSGTLAAFAAFVVAGLAAGHLLGGPVPEDRTVLAFATASRHPGVALAISSANFPDQKLVFPAILLFMIVSTVLSILYMAWRQSVGLGQNFKPKEFDQP